MATDATPSRVPEPATRRWTKYPSVWCRERWVRIFGPYRLVVEYEERPSGLPSYGHWCALLQGYGTLRMRDRDGNQLWSHQTRKEAQDCAMTWARRTLEKRIERIQRIGRTLGCKVPPARIRSALMR